MAAPQAPLILDDSLLIGRGTHRACYQHPADSRRCIKVAVNDAIPREQQRAIERELRMYRQLQRRGIDWAMLAQYFGETDTSLGPGYEYELIRDFDGSIARPLEDRIKDSAADPLDSSKLSAALAELRHYLLTQRILTSALHESNMVWQRSSPADGRLVMIDDIGNADYIPIRDIWPRLARNKIRRKWQRFAAHLENEFGITA